MPKRILTGREETQRLSDFLSKTIRSGETPEAFCERMETEFDESVFSDALNFLTHIQFNPAEARAHWASVILLRLDLAEKTGRDLGLLPTVVDYFTNVHPCLESPVTLEADALAHCTRLMIIDDLTGLFNRRHFIPELRKEMERSRRLGGAMALIMCDLDHFKRFNDTYGHAAGDRALAHVGEVLRGCARLMDQPVRYGGEEFALILPHTSKADGMVVAERVRAAMEREMVTDLDGSPLSRVTLSLGLASFPEDGETPEGLVEAADRALYRAKGQGRNQVCNISDELRRDKRRSVCLDAECLIKGDGLAPFMGRVLDISPWGVRCEAGAAIRPGAGLSLVLRDETHGLSLPVPQARSVWTESAPGGVWRSGISFSNLPDASRRHLESYLAGPQDAC